MSEYTNTELREAEEARDQETRDELRHADAATDADGAGGADGAGYRADETGVFPAYRDDPEPAADAEEAEQADGAAEAEPATPATPATLAEPEPEPEPDAESLTEPGTEPVAVAPNGAGAGAGAEADYAGRMRRIQVGFIDDPLGAALGADDLLSEVLRAFADDVARRRRELEAGGEGASPDTETLRLAVRRTREFVDLLAHARA